MISPTAHAVISLERFLPDLAAYPDVAAIVETLQQAKSVFITAHVGPDGDTLGTMLGLKWALLQLPAHQRPERIDCVIAGKMPDIYDFMPGIETVIKMDRTPEALLPAYDVAISVDCGSLERLGPSMPYLKGAKTSINLDHHISNDRFARLNLVVTNAGASGEVLALLLPHLGLGLTKQSAICMYVAILTDTGGFRFSSTSARIFELCGLLVQAGVEPEPIYKAIYERKSRAQAVLHAKAVLESQHSLNHSLVWGHITRADLQETGALDEHVEGVIDRFREIEGVQIAAILKETEKGDIKLSLRSNNHNLNVAAILERLFNGGGHKMAAGANAEGTLASVEAKLLPELEEAILKLPV